MRDWNNARDNATRLHENPRNMQTITISSGCAREVQHKLRTLHTSITIRR